MCVTSMTFVRGVIACAELLDEYSSLGGGTLNEIVLTTMPSRRSRCSHVVIMRP